MTRTLTIDPAAPEPAAIEEGESVVVEIEPKRVFAWGF